MKQQEILEEWKPIEGYEWLYEVSNLWRIKSLVDNHWLNREKILTWSISDWYLRVSLCKNKKHKNKTIHRVVATMFKENPENKPMVNHKDGNKLNCREDNLEWSTAKENTIHSWKNWLSQISEKHHFKINHPMKGKFWKNHNSSIPIIQYTLNWEFIREWDSMADVYRELLIAVSCISACCRWKNNNSWWYIWKFKN